VNPRAAKLAEDALLHFHNDRYEVLAWCVMPNHVHVLLHIWQTPLWKVVRSWKQFVQTRGNESLAERRPPARHEDHSLANAPCRRPALRSQREYWDTFMRDGD
jgi:REP element-mobilizing transposase RayT